MNACIAPLTASHIFISHATVDDPFVHQAIDIDIELGDLRDEGTDCSNLSQVLIKLGL